MAITRLGGANAISGTIPQGNIANASLGAVTSLPAAISTGKVLQIVSARVNTETSTTSSSMVATATEVSITPSSTSSKVFVMVTSGLFWANASSSSAKGCTATIYRGSSNLAPGGSGYMVRTYRTLTGTSIQTSAAMSILDSPSTTSATTYKCYIAATFGTPTSQWNSSNNDIATITAMEIEG